MSAYERKYGVATANGTHIVIPIVKAGSNDFAVSADWTPAAGDVKVTKDDGTPANIATLPTYVASQGWEFQFSAAELQCKKLDVLIVDSATKAIEDQFFTIETYGHASAMKQIDYSDVVRFGLTALPNANADAAGGLPISDAGGLDMDTMESNVASILTDTADMQPKLGTPADTDLATDIANVSTQIGNLGAASGGAINFAPIEDNTGGAIDPSSSLFAGSVASGTFASVGPGISASHSIDDSANDIDIVYGFQVGGSRQAVNIQINADVDGVSDVMRLQVYDHVGATWDNLAEVNQDNNYNVSLVAKHTGTGSELGKVYIRFSTESTTPSNLEVFECLVSAVQTSNSIGYADGAIWVDTNGSNTNTESFVDGVADNPVSTWAAALTLSSSLGINRFKIVAGSTITLTGDSSGYQLIGTGIWNLALGSQDVTDAFVYRAIVSGTSTSSEDATFEDCSISEAVVLPSGKYVRCGFLGTSSQPVVMGEPTGYVFINCFSLISGSQVPYFDFSGGNSFFGVHFRGWYGGIYIKTDLYATISVELLGGKITIESQVAGGGDVEIRGVAREVDLQLNDSETIQLVGTFGPVSISGTAVAAVVNMYGTSGLLTDTSTNVTVTDNTTKNNEWSQAKTNIDSILTDTADMQPKLGSISDLGGGANIGANLSDMAGATFDTSTDSQEAIRNRGDAAWTSGAGGSSAILMVNTTIATLGSQTSFTLTDGSPNDNAYNGMTIIVTDSATSTQKSVGRVFDYTGSTKTITMYDDPGIFTIAVGDTVDIVAIDKNEHILNSIDAYTTQIYNDTNAMQPIIDKLRELLYPNGAVYVDSLSGSAGTTSYTNGTTGNPSNSIASAKTIADNLGLKTIVIRGQANEVLDGTNWDVGGMKIIIEHPDCYLDLNSQTLDDVLFIGGTLTGTGVTSTDAIWIENSILENVNLPKAKCRNVFFEIGVVLTETGVYEFSGVTDARSTDGDPIELDFGAAVGATSVSMTNVEGDVLVMNMQTGDVLKIIGNGYVYFDSSNSGGTANVYGTLTIEDNSGALTINDNTLSPQAVRDAMKLAPTAGSPGSGSVDEHLDDIKTKTDQMTFTVANQIDANTKSIADSGTPATRLGQAMLATIHGKVNTIPSSATQLLVKTLTNDALADYNVADLIKNRVLTFTTGVCKGQSVGITDQIASASDPITLTVTTMANFANIAVDDEFVIT